MCLEQLCYGFQLEFISVERKQVLLGRFWPDFSACGPLSPVLACFRPTFVRPKRLTCLIQPQVPQAYEGTITIMCSSTAKANL